MDQSTASTEQAAYGRFPTWPGTTYFPSAVQNEALARLRYMCQHRHRLGLLLGGTGSGKSTVLQVLAQDLQRRGYAVVSCPLLGRENSEFLASLAIGLGHFPDERDSPPTLWRNIADRLRENRYQQRPTAILVDDADEAEMDVITSLTRLVQTDPTTQASYTVIATSHSNRCQLLGPRLKDLCELRVELEPWDLGEIRAYLERLPNRKPLQPEAWDAMLELTAGVPRRVVQLVELTLLAAADDLEVRAETLHAAYQELSPQGADREFA